MKLHKSQLIMTVLLVIICFFCELRSCEKRNTESLFSSNSITGSRPVRRPLILWVGLDFACCQKSCLEALTSQTVLCDSFQEHHKHQTVGCATARMTIHKHYDFDGSVGLMN